MELVYNKKDKYYEINNIIKIDVESALIIGKLKNNKSKDCLVLVDNIWYYNNYKTKTKLIDIIFFNENITSFKCLNNDINDYRRENIELECDSRYYDSFEVPPNVTILLRGESHKVVQGRFAEQYRNMYWKVKDNDKTYYMMHIINDIYTKISKRDIKKVLNFNNIRPFWFLHSNGYVATTIYDNENKTYYLHQYIMNVHNDNLTSLEKTVDHINRDKLDNRQNNLRFANISEQNSNRDKSARRCDAKTELPDWLEELPKYVQYRKEIYNKENNSVREFFVIQYPGIDKIWESSKSIDVSLVDKFKQTKLKLQLFDGIISSKQYNKESGANTIIDFPVGIRLEKKENVYSLIYDYRCNGNRYGLQRTMHTKNIQNELDCMIKDINIKYPTLNYSNYKINNTYGCKLVEKNIIEKENFISSDNIKKDLPKNFSIISEKESYYLAFYKSIDGKKYSMKQKLVSNNINPFSKQLDILIGKINLKFSMSLSK